MRTLFAHYVARPAEIPDGGGVAGAELAQRVTDWMAGMTDRFCQRAYVELTVPEGFAS